MNAFLDSIKLVTGPLTLLAFLAVIGLAVFQRSVKDKRGLEFLYNLLREKLTREQFYALASNVISRTFWFLLLVFIASLAAFVGDKALKRGSQKVQNIGGDYIEANGSNSVVVSGNIHGDVNIGSRGATPSDAGNTILSQPGTTGATKKVATTTRPDGTLTIDPPSGNMIRIHGGSGNVVDAEGGGNFVQTGDTLRSTRIRNPNFVPDPAQRKSAGLRIDVSKPPGDTEALRQAYSLQPLARKDKSDDEGRAKPHPAGCYGFTQSWIAERGENLDLLAWSRRVGGSATLEVHKRPGGEIALAGYVTEADARLLESKEVDRPLKIALYIHAYEESSVAVAIPHGRVEMSVLNETHPDPAKIKELSKGDVFAPAKVARLEHEMGGDRITLIVQ